MFLRILKGSLGFFKSVKVPLVSFCIFQDFLGFQDYILNSDLGMKLQNVFYEGIGSMQVKKEEDDVGEILMEIFQISLPHIYM